MRFILPALMLFSLHLYAQEKFTYSISGTIEDNSPVKTLYLQYELEGEKRVDSAIVSNKNFSISASLSQPVSAFLYTNNKKIASRTVFLGDKMPLRVSISDKIELKNPSAIQTEFSALIIRDSIRRTYFPLYASLNQKNDQKGLAKLAVIFDSLSNKDLQVFKEYFTRDPNSVLSLLAFERYASLAPDYAKLEADFVNLPEWMQNSFSGKNIQAKIQGAKSVGVGKPAPDFSQSSHEEKEISLKAFKGKYVLIDFWASWCGPCRKEHPGLVELYSRLKTKNFEIISISLDSEKTAWLNASVKDKITWINLSDLKGMYNAVAILYGVKSIPANYLVSPEGVIINKDLKGKELETRLTELLK